MKTFFIANVNVKNAEKMQEYSQGAAASMQAFGGELVTKGVKEQSLVGSLDYNNVAIFTFPSQEKLDAWYTSDAYQALIPLRNEAADMLLTSFSAPNQ